MKVVLYCHSLMSDWNHGNAHFLRGIATELMARGHEVRCFEPSDGWSMDHLLTEQGLEPIVQFRRAYPELYSRRYHPSCLNLDEALEGADLVLVHEWNEPELVRKIGAHRIRGGRYRLLFHDTHHRMVSDPDAMARFDLSGFDGILAFGQVIAEIYRKRGWSRRVWVWHEAADTRIFRPLVQEMEGDLVWVGNWGDDERTRELQEFLIEPAQSLRLVGHVHGVRYPAQALALLSDAGIEYRGWIANFDVPRLYARHRITVHVPRSPYVKLLPGIPTIRVFESMACGIPLLSSPWSDSEGLFRTGRDYLVARNGQEMARHMRELLHDPERRKEQARCALETIRSRHTCSHRVNELLVIFETLLGGDRCEAAV